MSSAKKKKNPSSVYKNVVFALEWQEIQRIKDLSFCSKHDQSV